MAIPCHKHYFLQREIANCGFGMLNTTFPVFRLTTIYWGASKFAFVTDSGPFVPTKVRKLAWDLAQIHVIHDEGLILAPHLAHVLHMCYIIFKLSKEIINEYICTS